MSGGQLVDLDPDGDGVLWPEDPEPSPVPPPPQDGEDPHRELRDADSDGVPDTTDLFPDDPQKAGHIPPSAGDNPQDFANFMANEFGAEFGGFDGAVIADAVALAIADDPSLAGEFAWGDGHSFLEDHNGDGFTTIHENFGAIGEVSQMVDAYLSETISNNSNSFSWTGIQLIGELTAIRGAIAASIGASVSFFLDIQSGGGTVYRTSSGGYTTTPGSNPDGTSFDEVPTELLEATRKRTLYEQYEGYKIQYNRPTISFATFLRYHQQTGAGMAVFPPMDSYYGDLGFSDGPWAGPSQPVPPDEEEVVTAADPVDVARGSFVYEATDLSFPGRGLSVSISRKYNSRSLHTGILGANWRMPLVEAHLVLLVYPRDLGQGTGFDLMVNWADGSGASYYADPSAEVVGSRWVSGPGDLGVARLLKNQDSHSGCDSQHFIGIRKPDGTIYKFCRPCVVPGSPLPTCWLSQIVDPYGNAITFERDEFGRCRTIVDALGNAIKFAYNGLTGRLESVTDWTARQIRYEYSNGGLELFRVIRPQVQVADELGQLTTANSVEAYYYTNSLDHGLGANEIRSGFNLTRVVDATGADSVNITYYSDPTKYEFDRVHQVTADGATHRFVYAEVQDGAMYGSHQQTAQTTVWYPDGERARFAIGSGLILRFEMDNGRFYPDGTPIVGSAVAGPTFWATDFTYNPDGRLLSRYTESAIGGPGSLETIEYQVGGHRLAHGNICYRRQYAEDGSGEALETEWRYEPVTNAVVYQRDPAGRVASFDYEHQELPYEDVLNLRGVRHWNVVPALAATPSLWGLGDINGNGVAGHTFEMVRSAPPQVQTASSAGPTTPGQVRVYETYYKHSQFGEVVEEIGPDGVIHQSEFSYGRRVAYRRVGTSGDILTETWDYDNLGRPTSYVSPDGRTTQSKYNSFDQIAEIRIQGEQTKASEVKPDGLGYKYRATTGEYGGIKSRLFYDAKGRLLGQTPPHADNEQLGRPVYWHTYSAAGSILSTKTFRYGSDGTQITSERQTFEYDGRQRVVLATNSQGAKVQTQRDSRGFAVAVIVDGPDVSPAATRFYYDEYGRQVLRFKAASSVAASNDVHIQTSYDKFGRRVGADYHDAISVRDLLDPTGLVLETTTRRSSTFGSPASDVILARKVYAYDDVGRVISVVTDNNVIAPDGSVSAASPAQLTQWYGYTHRLIWEVAAGLTVDEVRRPQYDQWGRSIGYFTGLTNNRGVLYQRDAAGRLERSEEHLGAENPGAAPQTRSTDFEYNPYGFLWAATDPEGVRTEFERDSSGRETRAINVHTGRFLAREYDTAGNILTRTEGGPAVSRTQSYSYDSLSRLIGQTDPEGNAVAYAWSSTGQLRSRALPGGAEVYRWFYNLDGSVDREERPGGITVQYGYNAVQQLQSLSASGADASVARSYGYDALGNVNQVTEQVGARPSTVTTLRHTSAGFVVEESATFAGTTKNVATRFDGNGRANILEYPSGSEATLAYTSDGRLREVNHSQVGAVVYYDELYGGASYTKASFGLGNYAVHQAFDQVGRAEAKYAAGAAGAVHAGVVDTTYDQDGELRARTWWDGSSETFTYDQFSRLKGWSRTVDVNGVATLASSSTWQFSPADVLTSMTVDGTQHNVASNALGQMQSVSGLAASVLYTPNGERSSLVDANTQLAEDWQWDALGRPYSHTEQDGVSVYQYTYDGLDRLVGHSGPATTRRLTYFQGRLLEVAEAASSREYIYGLDGPVCVVRDGLAFFMLVGAQGNTDAIWSDASGNFQRFEYEPFGRVHAWQDTAPLDVSAVECDLFFSGGLSLEGGLVLHGARVYDPPTAAFISRDPLGSSGSGGLSLYAYPGLNPLRWQDPTGMTKQETEVPGDSSGTFVDDGVIRGNTLGDLIDRYINDNRAELSEKFDIGEEESHFDVFMRSPELLLDVLSEALHDTDARIQRGFREGIDSDNLRALRNGRTMLTFAFLALGNLIDPARVVKEYTLIEGVAAEVAGFGLGLFTGGSGGRAGRGVFGVLGDLPAVGSWFKKISAKAAMWVKGLFIKGGGPQQRLAKVERLAVFHHTFDEVVESIKRTGLRPGSYATPTGGLRPLQAHIELALPPNGARNAVLSIDVRGLRAAGYKIPEVSRVSGQFGLPGGGYEMQFPYAIPPEFIQVVQP
ncbi:MAG: RHS repeat-associated core domain-containing protein [Planctomycetota bacterium]